MTSVFNILLTELQARILAALPDTADVPGIRYVEQDLGQIDQFEVRPAVPDIGVLVDFVDTPYVQRQFKAQWAEMVINLRLYFTQYSTSNSLAALSIREKALYYYELEAKLYLILQDWKVNGLLMLPMKRIRATSEKRNDGIRVRNIGFKCTYEDRTLDTGGVIVPPVGTYLFRIDFDTFIDTTKVYDARLIGKTIAHIVQVSREGDDKYKVIGTGIVGAKEVKLDATEGTLQFLTTILPDESIWAQVLTQ